MKCVEHKVIEYLCDDCGEPLGNHEGNPYISDGENNYCYDCALKHRLIDYRLSKVGKKFSKRRGENVR